MRSKTIINKVEAIAAKERKTLKNSAYFNAAAQSIMLGSVHKVVKKYLDDSRCGKFNYAEIVAVLRNIKPEFVKLITNQRGKRATGKKATGKRVTIDESKIAIVSNTSTGISAIALGLPIKKHHTICLSEYEFPSNRYVWHEVRKRTGCTLRFIPAQLSEYDWTEHYLRAIDKNTAVVALSSVQYIQGSEVSLAKIANKCRRYGAYLIVDGIQQLGAFPLYVDSVPVDALVAATHKWLLGTVGFGFVYCSDRLNRQLTTTSIGWRSVDAYDFEGKTPPLSKTIKKIETGSPNLIGAIASYQALQLINSIGVEAIGATIAARTQEITTLLSRGSFSPLLPYPTLPNRNSGIVTYRVMKNKDEVEDPNILSALLQKHSITTTVRGNGIRFSPHWYTTKNEIDYLEEILKKYHYC